MFGKHEHKDINRIHCNNNFVQFYANIMEIIAD